MTQEEYNGLLSWFRAYVGEFADGDGVLSAPLELKRLHSLSVADNARCISRELRAGPLQVQLASAAGLLHDTGRFTQFSQYRSFRDQDTIDHGEAGYAVLKRVLSGLVSVDSDRDQLLFAVRYHNRRTELIPPGASPAHDHLLRLVRDADKIDIMETVLKSVDEDGFRALPTMLPNIKLSRELTPLVLAQAVNRGPLSTESLGTLGDFLLMMSTWFYDLNYAPSRQLVGQRGILAHLRGELPDTPETRRVFEDVETFLKHGAAPTARSSTRSPGW